MTEQSSKDAATRLADIEAKVAAAASLAPDGPHGVSLIAISKTRNADAIRPLLETGHRLFGENRVQEAQGKWPELKADFPNAELHMVGQLQSNKAAEAVELFDAIHSVDRPSLVKALGKAMAKSNRTLPCFLQVDIGEEEQKGGCPIDGLTDLYALAREHGLPTVGLMCVPPLNEEPAPYFALLHKKAKELGLASTSMGMSGDYETAIMMGATHIRVGAALFGSRE